jgi:hypothetical protein
MLSKDELALLRAPFPLEAHTVREGHRTKKGDKIRWFVYVKRNEVQDRLEEIFPGEWGTEKPEVNPQGKNVSAIVGITIRGVTRWDGGEDDSNEGTKGALTNAFRRTAAYGWHVGRYLYDMPDEIWTESYPDGDYKAMRERKQEAFNKFAAWYKKEFANAQKPAPSVGNSTTASVTQQTPKSPFGSQPDAKPTWLNTAVGECWQALKAYLISEKIYTNEFELKNSLVKRGIVANDKLVDSWKTTPAHVLVDFLRNRHQQEQNDIDFMGEAS